MTDRMLALTYVYGTPRVVMPPRGYWSMPDWLTMLAGRLRYWPEASDERR